MYQTVLFDVDGVMLSEERYFDASALTVYELLYSAQYLGRSAVSDRLPEFTVDPAETDIRTIRRAVFAEDRVLYAIKSRGVNANWDMVYLQTALQLAYLLQAWVKAAGPETVGAALRPVIVDGWGRAAIHFVGEQLAATGATAGARFADFVGEVEGASDKAGLFARLEAVLQQALPGVTPFDHGRVLWTVCQETFQEWYVGDEHVGDTRQAGKRGFLTDEIPLVQFADFSDLLSSLHAQGVALGIATGRPELETMVPLDAIGWLSPFDRQRITTASDVLRAERTHPEAAPLSKPKPFSYLRSYLRTTDVDQVLVHPLPLPVEEAKQVLVVGDSIADLLAAQAIGCDFAAVLTGLEGADAREGFEARGADYIFDDVLGVATLFEKTR